MPEQDTVIDDGLVDRFQKLNPDQRKTAISALDDETAQHLLTSVQARIPKAPPLQPTTSADTFGGKVRNFLASGAEALGGAPTVEGTLSNIYTGLTSMLPGLPAVTKPNSTEQDDYINQKMNVSPVSDTYNATVGRISSGISNKDPYEVTGGLGTLAGITAPIIMGVHEAGKLPSVDYAGIPKTPRYESIKSSKPVEQLAITQGSKASVGAKEHITKNVDAVFPDLKKTELEVIKQGDRNNKGVKNQDELKTIVDITRKNKWNNDLDPYIKATPPTEGDSIADSIINKIPDSIKQQPSRYDNIVNKVNERFRGKTFTSDQIESYIQEARAGMRSILAKNSFDAAASEKLPAHAMQKAYWDSLRDNLHNNVLKATGKDIKPDLAQYGHLTEFEQTLNKQPESPSFLDALEGKYVTPSKTGVSGRLLSAGRSIWSSDNSLIRRAFKAYPEGMMEHSTIGDNPNLPVYEAPPRGDPPPPLIGNYNNYNGPTPKTGTPSSIHELISQEPIIKGTEPPPLINSYGQPNTHIPTGTQGPNLSIQDALRGGVPSSKAPPPLINTYGPSVSTKTGPSISNIHEIITGTKTQTPSQPVNITPDQPELRGVPQVKKPINPTPKVMTGEPEVTPAHAGLNKPISKVKSERIKPPIATPNPQSPPVEGSVVSKPVSTLKPIETPIVDLSDIPHDIPSFGPMDKARLHGLREKYYGKSDIEISQKYKPTSGKD